MAVGVGWVVVIVSSIVGFQDLLQCLMTEKSNVKQMTGFQQVFGCADVLVYVFKPFLNCVFSCYIRFA